MRILIVDDDDVNIQAAQAQFRDHDLTVAWSIEDVASYLGFSHRDRLSDNARSPFDIVLTDLMMPVARTTFQLGSHYTPTDTPVGLVTALLACMLGTPLVAVLSDLSHHQHPVAAYLDIFNKHEVQPTPFLLGDTTVMLSNNRNWITLFRADDLSTPDDLPRSLEEEEALLDAGKLVRAKYWRGLFDYLVYDSG